MQPSVLSARTIAAAAFSLFLTGQAIAQSYCASSSSFPWEDWIASVRINGQEKSSGKSAYSDFSSSTNFNLPVGTTPVKLTAGFSYFNYNEYWRIWADFNHDGDFADAGEMLLDATAPKGADGTPTSTLNANITVPVTAPPGVTRLRVSMKRGAAPSPCETLPFGEVEDYSINLASQGDCKKTVGPASEILCVSHVAGGNVEVQAASQGNLTKYTLNASGSLVSTSSAPILPDDSVLVQGNKVVKKLSNGSISYQKTISASVLSKFPSIEAASEMADGSFVLGGWQRFYSGGVLTNDSLVLIKTDASLNFQSFATVVRPGAGILADHKLFGLVRTAGGDVVALHQTSATFINKVFALVMSKFSPQLQLLGNSTQQFTVWQSWRRTPCGLFRFNFSYDFPSIKSSSTGTSSVLFDLETLAVATNRTHETGTVSYQGSYVSESYVNNLAADKLTASYRLFTPNTLATPFNVQLTEADGSVFEKRLPLTGFDHIARTGDTTILFLEISNGQLFATNPDCNSAGAHRPDLSLANLTIPSPSVLTGGVLTFNVDLKNTGDVAATGDYVIGAYLSLDNQLSTDDLLTGFINTGNTPVGTIPAVLGGITVPAYAQPGQYNLILKADLTNLILEQSEGNNLLVSGGKVAVGAGGLTDICGFDVAASADGFTAYGAAGLLSANAFRFSKYDATANTTAFREIRTDGQGGILSTTDFSLNEKCTPLLDENFLSATFDYNGIWLRKSTKNGTVLWLRQIPVFQTGAEIAIDEANNGDIWLAYIVQDGYSTQVFTVHLDYNGNRIDGGNIYLYPKKPKLKASWVPGFSQSPYLLTADPDADPAFGIPVETLYKINRTGGYPLWHHDFPYLRVLKGLAETPDGGTVFLEHFSDPDGGGPGRHCDLVKILGGNVVLTKNLGAMVPSIPPGAAIGFPNDISPISQATDGGYITGLTRSYFGTGTLPDDAFIIRLNSNFDTMWTRRFASPGNQFFRPLRPLSNGSFLGIRSFLGNSQQKLVKIGADGKTSPCTTPGQYCPSKGSFPWEDWIARVRMKDVDNASGKSQYTDFTGKTVNVNAGFPVDLTVGTGFSYFTFDEYWKAWIDYNQNGVFEEADETFASFVTSRPANGTPYFEANTTAFIKGGFTQDFTTRMRVAMKRGSYPTPCETFGFGEVEDYAIHIAPGGGQSKPDLSVGNFTCAASATQGANVPFTFNLINNGTASTASSFTIGAYLSADNLLDVGDALVGSVQSTGIPVGTTQSLSGSLTVPGAAATGSWFLILKADINNTVAEIDELNNAASRPFSVTAGQGGGADLELTLTADKATVPIYSNATFTFTVKNAGNQAVASAAINVGICGTGFFTSQNGLVYAGQPGAPTVGTYNLVDQQWKLANLLPGQSGVLKITLFTLTAAERKVFGYAYQQSPADPDSQPGAPANCQPAQDDEAVWTINAGQTLDNPDNRGVPSSSLALQAEGFQPFPNPAGNEVFIDLKTWSGRPVVVSMFNHLGVLVSTTDHGEVPAFPVSLDLSTTMNGQYFLKMETPGVPAVYRKLVVARPY